MKRILALLIVVLGLGVEVNAQCTPAADIGTVLVYPDTTDALHPAAATDNYHNEIHCRVPTDTLISPLPMPVPIDSAGIIEVKGLPANFSWASSSASNYWPGGTIGCIAIDGMPTVAEVGTYKVKLIIEVKSGTYSLTDSMEYDFEVKTAAYIGLEDVSANEFVMLSNYPNPASGQTTIKYQSPERADMNFMVLDFVGKTVHQEVLKAQKGENQHQFDVSDLQAGVYLYVIEYKGQRQMKKMIVN